MAASLTLYLVRHGETDCSREERYCGDLDVPLNANGMAAGRALAARYGDLSWQAIVSSPRSRAVETARPLADRRGLSVRIDERLREISYGAWEGVLETEVERRFPEEFRAWEADPAHVAPPGGETALAILERAQQAIDEIRERHPSGLVLVASHKATIRILVCGFLGIELSRFRDRIDISAGSVTVVEFLDRGPLLRKLADTGHLAPAG